MNKLFNNSRTAFDKILYKISDLSQEEIDKIVEKAKSMGLSQTQINQGLEFIASIKKQYK